MADTDDDKEVEGDNKPKGPKETNETREEQTSDSSGSSDTSDSSKKVGKKLEGIIKDIEELSVLELSELVKALEAKFGVTAAAPAAAVASPAPTGAGEETASEQTTFNVVLADSGANKISVIKAVREIVPTLGLKEAKDLVDAPPKEILTGVNKETAQEAKTKLEAAGAKVELK